MIVRRAGSFDFVSLRTQVARKVLARQVCNELLQIIVACVAHVTLWVAITGREVEL